MTSISPNKISYSLSTIYIRVSLTHDDLREFIGKQMYIFMSEFVHDRSQVDWLGGKALQYIIRVVEVFSLFSTQQLEKGRDASEGWV